MDLISSARMILEQASLKPGDKVSVSQLKKEDIIFEFDKYTRGDDPFDWLINPTDGGGGFGAVGTIFPDEKLNDFLRANKTVRRLLNPDILNFFIAKSKTIRELATDLSKLRSEQFLTKDRNFNRKEIDEVEKKAQSYAAVYGIIRTTERYKIIINDSVWSSLPEDVIGSTEYDYSFHGGEGNISSWLMAIGKSESDVKTKLLKGLAKSRIEYVGNEMELKYAQKNAIGRSE